MAWVEKRGDSWRVRFRNPDGSVATDSSHATKTAARTRAHAIETDQQRDVFINPEQGKITLAAWVDEWLDAHDVGPATLERYRSHLDIHILPRFGEPRSTALPAWPSNAGSKTSTAAEPSPLWPASSACCP